MFSSDYCYYPKKEDAKLYKIFYLDIKYTFDFNKALHYLMQISCSLEIFHMFGSLSVYLVL